MLCEDQSRSLTLVNLGQRWEGVILTEVIGSFSSAPVLQSPQIIYV
jgi:hypothetical protein